MTRLASALVLLGLGCSGAGDLEDGGPPDMDAAAGDAGLPDATALCVSAEQCDDGLFCNGSETCQDGRCRDGTAPECDDGVECTEDTCSEGGRECMHRPPDLDADGVADAECVGADGLPLGRDCDDTDANRFPDNPEICDDGHDEDCDPTTFGDEDLDRDGHHADRCCNVHSDGTSSCGDDCDDGQASVHAGAPELCDDRDNDCNGSVDDGLTTLAFGVDCDGDGFGVPTVPPVSGCVTPSEPIACDGGVWVPDLSDCDDDSSRRHPALVEVCDGIDNNCDAAGEVDEGLTFVDYYPDCDGDTHGDRSALPFSACSFPPTPPACMGGAWVRRATDCDDTRAAVNPASTEVCNGLDDECDGLIDDITDGVVVCELSETRACTLGGGGAGTQLCDRCVRFGPCS